MDVIHYHGPTMETSRCGMGGRIITASDWSQVTCEACLEDERQNRFTKRGCLIGLLIGLGVIGTCTAAILLFG